MQTTLATSPQLWDRHVMVLDRDENESLNQIFYGFKLKKKKGVCVKQNLNLL